MRHHVSTTMTASRQSSYTPVVIGRPTENLVATVLAKGDGATTAWEELVRRFSPLVWRVLRSFNLNDADRWDGFQATWLRTLEKLHTMEDPARFPGWLAQVATNEVRSTVLRARSRLIPEDMLEDPRPADDDDVDRDVLRKELVDAVRAAFRDLEPECQRLLRLLVSEPPLSYREIEEVLARPIGSIGPTRRRCLEKLRKTPAMRAFTRDTDTTKGSSDE